MQFVKRAIKILKQNWMSLILFEITYRVLGFVAFSRISTVLVRSSLSRLGYSYLTEGNFNEFITYPLTLLFIAAALLVLGLALIFEICVVFSCYESSWKQESVTLLGMIMNGLKLMLKFMKRYKFRWILYALFSTPFLGFQFIVWLISQTRILQYTMQQLMNLFPSIPVLIVLIAFIFLLSMLFTFSLPRRFMTDEEPKSITKKLMERIKVQGFRDSLIAIGLVLLFVNQANQVSNVLFYSRLVKYALGCITGGFSMICSLLFIYTYFVRSNSKRRGTPAKNKMGRLGIFLRKRPVAVVLTIFLISLELFFMITDTQNFVSLGQGTTKVAVTAHRGGARMAPENTISAIEYAIQSKSDVAEIDVQETKDGTIVLLHDTTLTRTTGLKANIWDMTYDEVVRLDAGVKFNNKFRGEKIPTLDEVIKYSKGKIKLNIEVKYNGHNKSIVPKVMEIIEENDFFDSCVLTSMNHKFLVEAKNINEKIHTGYTLRMTYGDLSQLEGVDFFSVKHTYITSDFVSDVHKMGKEIYAWTCNYQGDMQRMINAGVDNIITDDPELVRKVILGETGRSISFFSLFAYALK